MQHDCWFIHVVKWMQQAQLTIIFLQIQWKEKKGEKEGKKHKFFLWWEFLRFTLLKLFLYMKWQHWLQLQPNYLYLLTTVFQLSLTPSSSNCKSDLFFYEFGRFPFFFLDSTYKSDSMCLSLVYFTSHNAFRVHLCCCKWKDFHIFYTE